ncbi:MAG: hypothetical protein UR94_C0026G0006 [Parcubacteria group bacterium GW2011_GWA2_36_10]|nr:MAG: hypothetical protein UR94_C0026G0006 [Parcubacteria group bacterium GW2011_GWA2_36_10]
MIKNEENFTDLSNQDLERGYWWLQHKELINKIFLVFLILSLLSLYIWLAFAYLRYWQSGSWETYAQQLDSQQFNWAQYHQERVAKALKISSAQALATNGSLYNLVAAVENPNTDWLATKLTYRFVVNGQAQANKETFVLPVSNKFLLQLAYQAKTSIQSVQIEILETTWQRVGETDFNVFTLNDPQYLGPNIQVVEDKKIDLPARVVWQATNDSLFDFWQVPWQVAVYNQDRLVGVSELLVEDFKSLETKDLEVVWLYDLPRITKVLVTPQLNIKDKNNIKNQNKDNKTIEDRVNL